MTLKSYLAVRNKRQDILKVIILILAGIATLGSLLLPIASRPSAYRLELGSVAPYDFQAPRSLNYTSEILTADKITIAQSSIEPIYSPADPGVARHQIDRLKKSLDYISLIRIDNLSNINQKFEDIILLDDLNLSREEAEILISLEENIWQAIQKETITVLEQVMRSTIREGQEFETLTKIPSLISYAFSEENSKIIQTISEQFVIANSVFNIDATEAAIKSAVEAVEPVQKSYSIGEIIVRRGEIIDNVVFEALLAYDLVTPKDKRQEIFSSSLYVIIHVLIAGLYLQRRKPTLTVRESIVFVISVLLFIFAAKFLIPNRTILPYIFPLAGLTFALSTMFGLEAAIVFTALTGSLITFGMANSQNIFLFYFMSSVTGSILLGQGRRVSIFFAAGLLTGIVSAAIVLSSRIFEGTTDWIGIITLTGASFFNGMASASLGLLLQFLFSQILGVSTAIQLLEIARPDHPLLQFILTNSPGSYQHSLQVANLAEQAAKVIGADQLLTRVGAIYHDAGKAKNPAFFIENQISGDLNAHDDLDPYISAATIIQHVNDGVELAKKYRLPPRIQDFIREHHGTLMAKYFYVKAVELNGNREDLVNKDDFRYPGPKPQSKETALLMLADGCEARARADKPQTRDELTAVIQKVIEFCQREGQLENTELTMNDLNNITKVFTNTLINTYHPRIKYPEIKRG
jgi:putative nucleotidyltransferase with HDIG domain